MESKHLEEGDATDDGLKISTLKQNDVLVDDSSKSPLPTTTLEQITPLLKGTSII
jgi:hypothetical protein